MLRRILNNTNMYFIYLLCFLFATSLCDVNGHETCTTPAGGHGECITPASCDYFVQIARKPNSTSQDVENLKEFKCNTKDTKICCPLTCTTPAGRTGKCVPIDSCPYLSKEERQNVDKSKCSGSDSDKVCCAQTPATTHVSQKQDCNATLTAFPPDPSTKCCGYESSFGNKIIGGNVTQIDEYPWIVIIEYQIGDSVYLTCGGALISGRYVLTAAHCVNSDMVKLFGKPKLVRLGEYDTAHEGPDCLPVEAGGVDCTNGVTRINVESYVLHPGYNKMKRTNDIALLRLEKMAPYTDFIRPVCLPSQDLTLSPPAPDFSVSVAGWGATEDALYSPVKLQVSIPYVNLETCQLAYSKPPLQVQLSDRQLCAGGKFARDSCRGDSGGPLIYKNAKVAELLGVVSFGPKNCSVPNVPGVYTKIYAYKDWILENITN